MFQWANLVIISLTQKCNLNCKYCFLGDKESLSPETMSFNTYKKITEKIVFDYKKTKRTTPIQILLHGGEPLLIEAPLLDKMLTYSDALFKSHNIPVIMSIQTNGINLTKEYRLVLKEHSVEVGVSIDSLTQNLRANQKINQQIINNINEAHKGGLSLGTNTVVTQNNLNKGLKKITEALPKDLRCVKFNAVEDISSDISYAPSAKNYFEEAIKPSLLNYLEGKPYAAGYVDRIVSRFLIYKMTIHSYDNCKSTCQFKYCGAAVNLISIMPDGVTRLCDHWRGDEKFYNPKFLSIDSYDFLNLKQLKSLLDWIKFLEPLYKKCDNCLLSNYCIYPCPLLRIKRGAEDTQFSCELTKILFDYCEENCKFIIDMMIKNHRGIIETQEISIFRESRNPELEDYKIKILNDHSLEVTHV